MGRSPIHCPGTYLPGHRPVSNSLVWELGNKKERGQKPWPLYVNALLCLIVVGLAAASGQAAHHHRAPDHPASCFHPGRPPLDLHLDSFGLAFLASDWAPGPFATVFSDPAIEPAGL